ncbi:3-deoxy-7-phosphoheptulonate synthase class II [Salinispora tropica]|nr:3-deoxy-7-phosphoheptulonate synthase class II [Salinispora tropica]
MRPGVERSIRHSPPATNDGDRELCLDRWRELPRRQVPPWPDPAEVAAVCATLGKMPPIVTPYEVDELRHRLAEVCEGRAFLLQGGDCAETFTGNTESHLLGTTRTLLQMAMAITYGGSVPVVKVARLAGQYGKPRSSATDSLGLPAYRGDIINARHPAESARAADPQRMIDAYANSAVAMNLIRAYPPDDLTDLEELYDDTYDLIRASPAGARYQVISGEIDRARGFVRAWGPSERHALRESKVYCSHEALVLEYDRALTRINDGRAYALSGHFLWVGERTRQLDHAHVDFVARIANPIGVKLGPAASPHAAIELCERLNPENLPGRLTLISRMGNRQVRDVFPAIVDKVTAAGAKVVWQCDPMHGNTEQSSHGFKTRRLDRVVDELLGYFDVHRSLGTHPGGVHVELTGENVTECLDGIRGVEDQHLPDRYETACDPRLNMRQSLELALLVAEILRG